MQLPFEWDKGKAEANMRKHDISFSEAQTVFTDGLSIMIPDPDHSDDEERWIIMGMSLNNRLLAVIFTERNHHIRLITRKATRGGTEHTDSETSDMRPECFARTARWVRGNYAAPHGKRGYHSETRVSGGEDSNSGAGCMGILPKLAGRK